MFQNLRDELMGWLSDHLLDDVWAGMYEAQYIRTAKNVAFDLAFVTQFANPEDDAPTLMSPYRRTIKRGLVMGLTSLLKGVKL